MMDRTLKALSLMLSYPTPELQAAMPEIGGVLAAETRLTAAARRDLRPLAEALGQARPVYDLQEDYVMLFDRSRTLSLNLFEHVHGESRDRGGAMVVADRNLPRRPDSIRSAPNCPTICRFCWNSWRRVLARKRGRCWRMPHISLPRWPRGWNGGRASMAPCSRRLRQLSGAHADAEAVAAMLEQPDR